MFIEKAPRGFGVLGALVATVSCGPGSLGPAGIGEVSEQVQAGYSQIEGQGIDSELTILTSSSSPTFAAIVASGAPGWICGMTFISKHYAITASHCVDASSATGRPTEFALEPSGGFTVKQIDTTGIQSFSQTLALLSSQNVSGTTFPNWTIGHTLTTSDGYVVTPMTCRVTYRCNSSYGPANCSSFLSGSPDIALVHCPNRTATGYVTVNTGSPTSGSVVTNWFHEVLALMRNSNDTSFTTPPNNWNNYGFYNNIDSNNWHYLKSSTNQLLPLQFTHFKGGANYQITGTDSRFPNERFTDTPGCHGTSGSGIFINGTSTLLGPIANGLMGQRLCWDMDTAPHGGNNISYVLPSNTRALEARSQVQGDR